MRSFIQLQPSRWRARGSDSTAV